jgi:hypothetical protein
VIIPTVVFPLFLLAVNSAGLEEATRIPDFPTDSYLDFAIVTAFIQGALFATTTAGSEIATDIETGFLNRLSMTPLQRSALLLGQLAGAVTVGMLGALLYLAVALVLGVDIRSGVGGVAVLLALTFLICVAFGAIGAFMGRADRIGRGRAGRLPAAVRRLLPELDQPAAPAHRDRLVPDDRDLEPDLLPRGGPAVAGHHRLGRHRAAARVRDGGGDHRRGAGRRHDGDADADGADMSDFWAVARRSRASTSRRSSPTRP